MESKNINWRIIIIIKEEIPKISKNKYFKTIESYFIVKKYVIVIKYLLFIYLFNKYILI
jgi:hypothetical protein